MFAGRSKSIPRELLREVRDYAYRYQVSPAAGLLLDEIRRLHGTGVRSVIYYGSCLQTGRETEGLLDLYVLVDDYLEAFKSPVLAFLNWLLPPNVFYLELPLGGNRRIRAKYAVITLSDFVEKTSGRAFHSYFWARFCQPVAVIYYSDKRLKRVVEHALARAIITFCNRVLPCMESEFTARKLWLSGLRLSYGAELRPEKEERLSRLWDSEGRVLERVTEAALSGLSFHVRVRHEGGHVLYRSSISAGTRMLCRIAWMIRTIQGKILSVLRLLKASYTFRGGVDYALWKIRRHTGLEIEVSPFLRRHPVLAMMVLSWNLLKKRAIR